MLVVLALLLLTGLVWWLLFIGNAARRLVRRR